MYNEPAQPYRPYPETPHLYSQQQNATYGTAATRVAAASTTYMPKKMFQESKIAETRAGRFTSTLGQGHSLNFVLPHGTPHQNNRPKAYLPPKKNQEVAPRIEHLYAGHGYNKQQLAHPPSLNSNIHYVSLGNHKEQLPQKVLQLPKKPVVMEGENLSHPVLRTAISHTLDLSRNNVDGKYNIPEKKISGRKPVHVAGEPLRHQHNDWVTRSHVNLGGETGRWQQEYLMPNKMAIKKRQPPLQPGESLRPKPRGFDAVNNIRLGANQQSDFQLGDHATDYSKHPRDVITDKKIYKEKRPNLVPGESIRHRPTLVNNMTCDSMRAAIKQHEDPTDYRARDGHFRVSTIAQKKALQGTQASHSLGSTVASDLNGGPKVRQTGVFVPNRSTRSAGQGIVGNTYGQPSYGSSFYEPVPAATRAPDPVYRVPQPKSGHLRTTKEAHLPTEIGRAHV